MIFYESSNYDSSKSNFLVRIHLQCKKNINLYLKRLALVLESKLTFFLSYIYS